MLHVRLIDLVAKIFNGQEEIESSKGNSLKLYFAFLVSPDEPLLITLKCHGLKFQVMGLER